VPSWNVSVCPGNTGGLDNFTAPAVWNGGEALLRFQPGPVFTNSTRDFFAPANWQALDDADTDIGSSGALLLDLPQSVPAQLAVAMGKNGVVYLADRNNLGGVGGEVFQAQVSSLRERATCEGLKKESLAPLFAAKVASADGDKTRFPGSDQTF
jgi:hypothetical protein